MTDASPHDIRRYLLGAATDEEAAAIEAEYFREPAAIDRLEAIEEDLVEEYVTGDLPAQERERFERVYLASPVHRRRVNLVRQVQAAASAAHGAARLHDRPPRAWLGALAIAAAVLLAVGVWWMRSAPKRTGTIEVRDRRPAPSIANPAPERPPDRREAPAGRAFALTLSPIAVRGAGDAPRLVIPPATDIVVLNLQTEAGAAVPLPARATVRAAGGDEVWQGPAHAPPAETVSGPVAQIEVPASVLRADDYVITLFAGDPRGGESERARYVLHVRDR